MAGVFDAQQGTGLQFLMVTSNWSGDIVDISRQGHQRGSVEVTHSETSEEDSTTHTIYREFIPSKIVDGGTYRLTVHLDRPLPPMTAAREILRITLPLASGESTAAKLEVSGFMTNEDADYQPLADDTMRQTFEFKVSGAPTYTAASS